jgi:uncharacterized protein YdaU (DUF1376 family)
VLRQFFELQQDGWHQLRADADIYKFHMANRATPQRLLRNLKRQENLRQRSNVLRDALNAKGVVTSWNVTMGELWTLVDTHGIDVGLLQTTSGVDLSRRDSRVTGVDLSPHQQLSISAGASIETLIQNQTAENKEAAAAARVCKAMKQQGLFPVNPGDPRLLAILKTENGANALVHTAAEAVALGKKWGWVLETVRGRQNDVARNEQEAQEGPKTARQRADAARLGGWLPSLKQIDPGPFKTVTSYNLEAEDAHATRLD